MAARTVFGTWAGWSRHWPALKPIEEGAALWESVSQNHPFIDGNKRVAVTVTAAFLKVNGYRLEFDDLTAFAFLIGLYETGRMRFIELDAWLRENVIPK